MEGNSTISRKAVVLILIWIISLTASCSFAAIVIKPSANFADIVNTIADSDKLKTSSLVNFVGDYQITRKAGFGSVFRWSQKQTSDNFLIEEITASNWHHDSVDILRNINFKILTTSCYHYKAASLDFSLNGSQVMPPNPHSVDGAQVIFFSIKKYSWGNANFYFDKNQCLNYIRFTSSAELIVLKH